MTEQLSDAATRTDADVDLADRIDLAMRKLRFVSAAICDCKDVFMYRDAKDGLVFVLDEIADELEAVAKAM